MQRQDAAGLNGLARSSSPTFPAASSSPCERSQVAIIKSQAPILLLWRSSSAARVPKPSLSTTSNIQCRGAGALPGFERTQNQLPDLRRRNSPNCPLWGEALPFCPWRLSAPASPRPESRRPPTELVARNLWNSSFLDYMYCWEIQLKRLALKRMPRSGRGMVKRGGSVMSATALPLPQRKCHGPAVAQV